MAQEIEIQLEDLKIGGLRWGQGNTEQILAIHGWLDNAASFHFLAPLLAAQDCDVVAIDLAGHGNSQHRPKGVSYHLVDYLRDVHQILDALQWTQPILLGHSLGGIIASMLCAAAPERVAKLIMLESIGPLAAPATDTTRNLKTALAAVLKQKSAKRVYQCVDDAVTDRLRGFGNISHKASHVLVSRNLAPTKNGWLWKTDARLRWPSFIRLTEQQVNNYLSSLQLPVLLVAAEDGYISLDPDRNPRLAYLNDARLMVAGGGHHFHMDGEVDKISAGVRDFL